MELYMSSPSDAESTGASALGYLKSPDSMVHVEFELAPPIQTEAKSSERLGRKDRKVAQRKAVKLEPKEINLRLHQDLGTLSREQGDTGKSFLSDSVQQLTIR
jgi:hypothetical protein